MPLNRIRIGIQLGLLGLVSTVMASPFTEAELAELVRNQAEEYFASFQHPETGVLYGAPLSGKANWTTPEEILAERPHPWGYGSRIEDTALHTGHLLVALLDAWETQPEPWLREQIAKHFAALRFIGSLPETHPKPGKPALEGLVPRGPHPDDPSAWFDDSSMDQHTTYVLALALYAMSDLVMDSEKQWIAASLGKVGRRLEGNDWGIFRADGETRSHVGFSWKGINSSHVSILLPTVLGLYRGTEDAHWKDLYESLLKERDGKRWELMHPGPHVQINRHPIYANQNAFRLNAYYHFEQDEERRAVIAGLLDQSVRLQLERDFPGEMYRAFHEEQTWERLRKTCGWADANLHGAAQAWSMYEPDMLTAEDAGLAVLAHVRFPLGGYHMALLSPHPEVAAKAMLPVQEMMRRVDLDQIHAGETHYLFTVAGLHLLARARNSP